jgi:conjugative transfer signal peptidase TraF
VKRFLNFVFAVSLVFLIAAKLLSYRVVFQITPSMPKGVYWIEKNAPIDVGSIILFTPSPQADCLIKERKWGPKNLKFLLIKPVVAKRGDHVLIRKGELYINGAFWGPVQKLDSQGLPLPELHLDHFLLDGEYFTVSGYEKSFDSRYFGVIKKESILGSGKKIL